MRRKSFPNIAPKLEKQKLIYHEDHEGYLQ